MKSTLNKRQDHILLFLSAKESASVSEVLAELRKSFGGVSKITVNRDLKKLIEFGFLKTAGRARALTYSLSPQYQMIRPIDPANYFLKETDERTIMERFNFNIFDSLNSLFTLKEKNKLKALGAEYKKNLHRFPAAKLEKEFERLTIEFSWKSSRIEGNTYTLLETERLIQNHEEAKGHAVSESAMILNHKTALDYVRAHPKNAKRLSVFKIKEIHTLLVKDLPVATGLRKRTVGIVGTRYRPLDNQYQIRESLEKACTAVNRETDPFAKALMAMVFIAYIQPFEDGNKRTSRMVGNAILMAYDLCPLSYRSANEVEYKKAVILFYEQNNIHYFKKLFMEQVEFAIKNYFAR